MRASIYDACRSRAKAGGDCRYELFESSEHEWTGKPGPQTQRAYEMVKAFIARNVNGAVRK